MTPPMIAAQEQRLTRIAELSRMPPHLRTVQEWNALRLLTALVRKDAR